MFKHARVETLGRANYHRICGLLLGALGLSAAFYPPLLCKAQEPEREGAGLIISGKASAGDVGLPIYARSKPHKDGSHDSDAARLGLWGGGSGFKLAVVKMETGDSPEKVAKFYKRALAKYGKVLDCSNPSSGADTSKKDNMLTCGDDRPGNGGMLFKSGTQEKQHIVGIQPNGQGTIYQLVALGNWKNHGKN